MNDPFALDLTIRLLMLGLGSAMFAGSFLAFINKDKNDNEFYKSISFGKDKNSYIVKNDGKKIVENPLDKIDIY